MDIQKAWDYFAEKMRNIIKKHIPLIKNVPGHGRPYVDYETSRAINVKKNKWKKYKHCSNHYTYDTFKRDRNKLGMHLKRSNYKHEKNCDK